MTPVFQRIICSNRGDCQTAAVASILDLPYEQVPAWLADAYDRSRLHEFHDNMYQWFRDKGFHYLTIEWEDLRDWRMLVGAYCIASMPSQKFPGHSHAVIGTWVFEKEGHHKFVIAHDPNPNNKPYDSTVEPKRVCFLVPLQPRL